VNAKSLKDKVVVITGSTRGFGYAIAEAEAIVSITGRSKEAVTCALKSLHPKGRVSILLFITFACVLRTIKSDGDTCGFKS
jgi:NAD(P)-dependent dehydrogenase (short-subunit alcohol dehydrogenase family)